MKRKRNPSWKRLDNAAKIFPPNSNRRDTKVFRFSCTLKEDIEQEILQEALNETLIDFPMYQSIMRRGLFWYYFEESDEKSFVKKEYKSPCAVLYDENIKSLLFEVTYFGKRINLEIYHALTDGTGALQFLRTLVLHYITLKHPEITKGHVLSSDYDASFSQKDDDSFHKYFVKDELPKKVKRVRAYKVKGERHEYNTLQVINGTLSAKEVLKEAHKYNTTLTVFLCSLLICAIGEEMAIRERKYPIVLSIPVNLRSFFQSASARNFFSVINVKHSFLDKPIQLEEVISHLHGVFQKELTEEAFQQRLNYLVTLEKNYATRMLPLFLKKPALRIAHKRTNQEITSVLSNIGRITMPTEVENYIQGFDVCVSTDKIQACVCSYKDRLSISFTSPFINTDIQKNFFRALTERGIHVTVATNIRFEEDERNK